MKSSVYETPIHCSLFFAKKIDQEICEAIASRAMPCAVLDRGMKTTPIGNYYNVSFEKYALNSVDANLGQYFNWVNLPFGGCNDLPTNKQINKNKN